MLLTDSDGAQVCTACETLTVLHVALDVPVHVIGTWRPQVPPLPVLTLCAQVPLLCTSMLPQDCCACTTWYSGYTWPRIRGRW
jgi:hypothetical protein